MNMLIKCLSNIFSVLFLSCIFVTGALAQGKGVAQLPAALRHLKAQQDIEVVKSFPTDSPVLTGYVIKNQEGKTGLVFAVGPYLVSGTLIDANGHNASARFAQQELPKPDYQKAARTLANDDTLITEGATNAPAIYVFADPNCIFCHELWKKTRPWVKAGKLQIHWVMVGFLKSTSRGRAAAMMAKRKEGGTVINQDEAQFDTGSEEGAIQPLSSIPPKLEQALHRHSQMMSQLGFSGTPSLLYKDSQGHWHGKQGVPELARLSKSLGIQ